MSEVKIESFWRNVDSFFILDISCLPGWAIFATEIFCVISNIPKLVSAMAPSKRHLGLISKFPLFCLFRRNKNSALLGLTWRKISITLRLRTADSLSKKTLKFVLPTMIISDFETGFIAAAIAVFEIDQLIKNVLSLHPSSLQKNSIGWSYYGVQENAASP